jgi:hypothetical protein
LHLTGLSAVCYSGRVAPQKAQDPEHKRKAEAPNNSLIVIWNRNKLSSTWAQNALEISPIFYFDIYAKVVSAE